MKVLTCAAARRRLEAFHDEELAVSEQIAVSSHLDWCEECAARLADLQLVRGSLREALRESIALSAEEEIGLHTTIVSRAKAEEAMSFDATMRDVFQDMHFVYAGMSAAVAVLLCVVVTFGAMRAATIRPEALVGMLKGWGSLGTNENPVSLPNPGSMTVRVQMPRPDRFPATTNIEGGDAVVAFMAVLTREGRVQSLELLRDQGTPWIAPGYNEDAVVKDVLEATSEARFQPASVAGSPVAVNVVWIVAHTTVRGSQLPAVPTVARRRTA